jgi:hypothetical protein
MRPWFLACCMVALALPGCIPYSSFQSARIVPEHKTQAVASASRFDYGTHDGEPDAWTCLDARGRLGLGARFDASFGITTALQSGNSDAGAAFGGDLRYGLWPDHLALVLPVSIIVATVEVGPGFVATVPVHDRWDISVAARRDLFIWPFEGGPHWSCNLGLGIPVPRSQWTMRPEVGLSFSSSSFHNANLFAGIALETAIK